MVFFKQYLLTLTCIVIVVQVMPASATTDEELSRTILLCCGFEDTNSAIDGITNVNYLDRIFYLMNGYAFSKEIMIYLGTDNARADKKKVTDDEKKDKKKASRYSAVINKIIAMFVKNTGSADEKKVTDDEKKASLYIGINKGAAENNLEIKDFIGRIATNLSIRYTQFYGKEKNIETVKNGSKAPVTFFCQTYMNSSNEEFKKLFTLSYIDTVLDIKNK
uniref:Uncharacterized protein n=1 Tax=Acyrthosiphon pisum TaxID=7029 RepID=C4WX23_ACYPI|nr:uncharacterized protein LOC100302375 precursor [Acyrthosiphon pisum]BAH72443.1 hypothetical protein [Acyrthosiphon pisum]